MPDSTTPLLFLAKPGTQETHQLDVESVRQAVARGEIGLDNWAWSADRNEWVPLAELPQFAAPAAPAAPVPVMPVVPQVSLPAAAASTEEAPAPQQPLKPHAATYFSSSDADRPSEFPVLRIAFIALGVLIVGLVVINYFMVEKPFRDKMAGTPFADVSAHAHLGAFMQPTALLIHVLPSKKVTTDNFADLLKALAESAPRGGVPGIAFQTVSLTPGWLGKYAISATDWESFADMSGFSPAEKREFVLSHVERSNGTALLVAHRSESDDERKARADQVWSELVATFHSS